MSRKITVLMADDSYQVRQSVKAMLEFEVGEFEVVGEAGNGVEAVELAARLSPDVILMDVNMPQMDGIAATQKIMRESPVGVVIISVQGEQEYLRRAMKAGAKDYLVKPFTCEELVGALRSAAAGAAGAAGATGAAPSGAQVTPIKGPKREGRVISIFSTKGGVGKTTVAANLAAALSQGGSKKVAAIDLDLEFGVLATMMGVKPQATIVDLCRLHQPILPDVVGKVLAKQVQSGVGVLAAPPLPHLASEVDGNGRADQSRSYLIEIIEALRIGHDFIIIDTSSSFREATLIALDRSDLILMVTQPEIPALESTAKGLDILLERLEYPREKVQLLLNRSDTGVGLSHEEIAESLGVPLTYMIPGDEPASVSAANAGIPVVLRRSKSSPMIDAIYRIALQIASGAPAPEQPAQAEKPRLKAVNFGVRRLFGLF